MKNTYVNDYAGVLTKFQIKELNARIHKLERIANIQLAIVLVNKLPKQYEIEDYSLLIARKWRVGQNQRGLVYVAAIKQRKQRLEVSRNLDTLFNDGANAIILDGVKPFFRATDYNGGLLSLVGAITNSGRAALIQQKEPVVADPVIKETNNNGANIVLYILLAIPAYYICKLVFLFILGVITRKKPKQQIDFNDDNQVGYGGYQQPYGSSRSSSGFQSGSFAAGAATGYAARALQEHMRNGHHYHEHHHDHYSHHHGHANYVEPPVSDVPPIVNNDDDANDYGNWGARNSSNSNDNSSSSSGGYSGSGTSSDW